MWFRQEIAVIYFILSHLMSFLSVNFISLLRKVREKVKNINEVEMRFHEKNISHYCIAPLSVCNAQMMLSGNVNLKNTPPSSRQKQTNHQHFSKHIIRDSRHCPLCRCA